jgi:predicted MPP superfamily phosphohydrolase
LKAWPFLAVAVIQALLLAAHWFLFRTAVAFLPGLSSVEVHLLRVSLLILAFSFIVAAMVGFRYSNLLVRVLYRIASIWLGFLSFFFWAACFCRVAGFFLGLTPLAADLPLLRPVIASALFSLAILVGLYGMANARRVRVRRVPIPMSGLPPAWRGRRALVLSDLHLGNVCNIGFARRMAVLAAGLEPEIVLIPGDLFDGSMADPDRLLAPFLDLNPPLGIYFTAGNHDEFGGSAHYTAALKRAGIHVLEDQSITVEGVRIVGTPYGSSVHPLHLRVFLESLQLDDGTPCILLNHVPNRLPIVEKAGVSLLLSGHTHGGQIFPFTWATRRIFGKFTYGLQQFGRLTVYTSTGCGTWGPPMRLGAEPEVVLLTFSEG